MGRENFIKVGDPGSAIPVTPMMKPQREGTPTVLNLKELCWKRTVSILVTAKTVLNYLNAK